jgi:hypothetical protein
MFAILIKGLIVDTVGWLSVIACSTVIIFTIINNLKILIKLSNLKENFFIVNILICSLQILSIVFNGFQFKYNQGIEVASYIEIDNKTKDTLFGTIFNNFNFGFTFKFAESDYSLIRLNILYLLLTLLFFYFYRNFNQIVNKDNRTLKENV